jgi:hypothetical protein
MGHDDYDEPPPPDEQAEDFANFDPETYLRRRNAGRYEEPLETEEDGQPSESTSDDFASFNAGDYVRKRYGERGRPYQSESPSNREVAPAGRGRRAQSIDPIDARARQIDKELRGERRGCFSRLFDFGEAFRLYQEILAEAGPLVRIVGCVLVLVIGALCVVGYLVLSALTRHP